MTWKNSYSSQSTINLGPYKGGSLPMFHLKELLKSVGWTVVQSSDGTTYNGSGDQITSADSGSNGMNNNSAWYRIQDPAVLREYVFQRGTNDASWKGIYSASDKFTATVGNATTVPTANDEQGIFKAVKTNQTIFSTSAAYRYHIAVQDAAHNGVYAWWMIGVNFVDATPETTCIFCDAMDASYGSGDNDPSVHFGNSDGPIVSTLTSTSVATNGASLRGWMRYGEVDEEWAGLTSTYYIAASFNLAPYFPLVNPHNDRYVLLPLPMFRHSSTGSLVGFKGVSRYIRWNPSIYSFSYPAVLSDASDGHLVHGDLAFPGFPSGVTPLF